MKTIKTLAEALTGCTVEMGKTYYSKAGGRSTRLMKIYDLPKGREEEVEVLLSALEAGGATVIENCPIDNYLHIRIALPENQTWEQYQTAVLGQEDFTEGAENPAEEESVEEESAEEEAAADELAKLEVMADNFIATLDIRVGVPTVIPGYGVAMAFSEEDKSKLIAFIKKVVMFGIPEAIRLSNNPS